MTDVNKTKDEEILVDSSINEDTKLEKKEDSDSSNARTEGLLKEVQAERAKRHELEAKMAELESKFEANNSNPNQDDIDLELIADRLAPTLQKRGFITAQQREDEERANEYAKQLKDLSGKYDGKDGRPAFDPSEVANYAKNTGIFNLEAAYRDMHWKELVDFEKKQTNDDIVETEKPNSTNQSKPNEKILLTREYLEKRLKEPDGKQWYEKNHEKIHAAMAKGQL